MAALKSDSAKILCVALEGLHNLMSQSDEAQGERIRNLIE